MGCEQLKREDTFVYRKYRGFVVFSMNKTGGRRKSLYISRANAAS
jgi:hypothetical protein